MNASEMDIIKMCEELAEKIFDHPWCDHRQERVACIDRDVFIKDNAEYIKGKIYDKKYRDHFKEVDPTGLDPREWLPYYGYELNCAGSTFDLIHGRKELDDLVFCCSTTMGNDLPIDIQKTLVPEMKKIIKAYNCTA